MRKIILLLGVLTTLSLYAFQDLSSYDEYSKKINSGKSIVIYYSTTCGYCDAMKSNVRKVLKTKNGIKVYQVEVDSAVDIVSEIGGVPAVPAVTYIKNGEIVDRYLGLQSVNEIKSVIKKVF
jgi:thioredoxin 1